MKFEDFPYRTTMEIVQYSKLVTDAINIVNNTPRVWKIEEDLTRKKPRNSGDDLAEYWDNYNVDFCFGRYLELKTLDEAVIKKTEKAVIKSWFGLDSTPWYTTFIMWFKKDEVGSYIVDKLRNAFNPTKQYHESQEEVWVTMDETTFKEFCDSAYQVYNRQMIIKIFWDSVLTVL